MIRFLRVSEQIKLPAALATVRKLTNEIKAGTKHSPEAFRQLLDFQLRRTVMHSTGQLKLKAGPRAGTFDIAGPNLVGPLPLRDGHFLRVSVSLMLAKTTDGIRMKVVEASYQYQLDETNDSWVFRYDYERNPPNRYPAGHLHIRGTLHQKCLPRGSMQELEDVHFPILRCSIEAVIRLLADQFQVSCTTARSFWRPVLALSEELFLAMAHKPLSGPAK